VKDKFRILIVEGVKADAELVIRELREGGLAFHTRRVETKEGFLHELKHRPPDLILSDQGRPSFDGLAALAVARQHCPDTPFIFVTGALGEEMTIATFENGATDYVLKSRLAKLVPVVQRALHEAEDRRLLKLAEADRERLIQELHEALTEVKALGGLVPICSGCKKIRDHRNCWKPLEVYFREHLNMKFSHGFCPECMPKFYPRYSKALE
jgi:CheY-like chemotaxis protein